MIDTSLSDKKLVDEAKIELDRKIENIDLMEKKVVIIYFNHLVD